MDFSYKLGSKLKFSSLVVYTVAIDTRKMYKLWKNLPRKKSHFDQFSYMLGLRLHVFFACLGQSFSLFLVRQNKSPVFSCFSMVFLPKSLIQSKVRCSNTCLLVNISLRFFTFPLVKKNTNEIVNCHMYSI